MKRILRLLLCLLSLSAIAEETKIAAGISLSAVETALTKNGFPYGDDFMLQWMAEEGSNFLFCRLDEEHTLVVVFSIESKKVTEVMVHCPAPVMVTRADAVILHPISVGISPSTYSMVFKKGAKPPQKKPGNAPSSSTEPKDRRP